MDKDATAVVVETPAAAAAAAVTDVDNEPADAHAKRLASERALWWWNLGCGLLHLSQAAAVLGLGECWVVVAAAAGVGEYKAKSPVSPTRRAPCPDWTSFAQCAPCPDLVSVA